MSAKPPITAAPRAKTTTLPPKAIRIPERARTEQPEVLAPRDEDKTKRTLVPAPARVTMPPVVKVPSVRPAVNPVVGHEPPPLPPRETPVASNASGLVATPALGTPPAPLVALTPTTRPAPAYPAASNYPTFAAPEDTDTTDVMPSDERFRTTASIASVRGTSHKTLLIVGGIGAALLVIFIAAISVGDDATPEVTADTTRDHAAEIVPPDAADPEPTPTGTGSSEPPETETSVPTPVRPRIAKPRTSDTRREPRASADANKAKAAYDLGTKRLIAGDTIGAVRAYLEAVTAQPTLAVAHRQLGLAYERAGDKANAMKSLRQYLRLAPREKDSQTIRERIRQLQAP
jgi:hypothetical protein